MIHPLRDVDLFGIYLPPLAAPLVLALLVWLLLVAGLRRAGFYKLVWHPPLFNLCLYVLVLFGFVCAMMADVPLVPSL